MECKITSTDKRPCSGWTLVEMLIGMGVGGLVLAGIMGTTIFTSRSFVAVGNYCDLNATGRNSAGYISSDIRQANYLVSYTTNMLVFQTTDPYSLSNAVLTYAYDPVAQTLTRSLGLQGGTLVTNTILLANCTYFHFDLYQRDPTATNGGDLVAFSAPTPTNLVKALDLSWTCSRTVLGMTHDSENVQATRVVIRKN